MTQTLPIQQPLHLRPVDASWLALYRIGFGACLLWQMWKFFSTDLIRSLYIEPTHHFTWYGLGFVRPWPETGMYLHFSVMAVAASCILVGFHYRLASFIFGLGMSWIFLIDQAWYLNHYYLLCLLSFLGVFLPANCQWSVDCRINPRIRSCSVPAWTLWLLRFQLGVPYFFGGIAKLNADWIAGEPLRTWLARSTDFPLIGTYFTSEWCVQLFVWGGLLLDLFVVPLLLWKPTRTVTLIIVTAFHLTNARLFQIGVFPWLMIWATITVFLPPATIARILRRKPGSIDETTVPLQPPGALTSALLCIWVCLQLLMPVRHFFYPGHTAFTREGHQFAWRMRLNIRETHFEFTALDPDTGETQRLPLHRWLTAAQEEELGDADHLLQLARWMEEDLKQSGMNDPVITVEGFVALNGRPPNRFVDPQLDLSKQPRTFAPADWVTQQPTPLVPGAESTEVSGD